MIRVERSLPPRGFDYKSSVAIRGLNAMWELIGDPRARIEDIPSSKLPDHWTCALPPLCDVYRRVCSYLGLRIYPGTGSPEVDHFKPKEKHQRLAYSWGNFRLSSRLANTFKSTHEDLIDPFDVCNEWFGLNLANGHVFSRVSDARTGDAVERTITRLRLNAEETFVQARLEYINDYFGIGNGPSIPFEKLERDAPFVAREIARQGMLKM
jgi:hypothetical protein